MKLNNKNQQSKEGKTAFKCGTCNGTFPKPILATLSTNGQTLTYYACPCCLTKVVETKNPKSEGDKETPPLAEKVEKTASTSGSDVECKHFLGYLKKRPKDTSIPDECLLCEKMIKCLIH